MSSVLAHGGAHWAESLIYLVPVLLVAVVIAVAAVRDRRRSAGDPPGEDTPLDPSSPGR